MVYDERQVFHVKHLCLPEALAGTYVQASIPYSIQQTASCVTSYRDR